MIVPAPLAVVASVVGCIKVGINETTFCWFNAPVPRPPTVMLKVRFWKITLLYSSGYDTLRQLALVAIEPEKCPVGQVIPEGRALIPPVRFALFWMDTIPAG